MLTFTLAIDWKITLFAIFGGLGIFLYGINLMSNSLKKIAGARLRKFLEKSTNTPLKGIFVGIIITAIIQSSSATSALVVGLVRAGLMTLPQAVGVIFGANIGTTITSVLIATNIGDYAFPIIFIGAVLIFFFSNKKVNNYGKALVGFGMLFFGLETMGDALKSLAELDGFTALIESVANHKILGVLVGAGTTAVVQSSSATIGILQQLYENGGVPLVGAIAIVLGDNIGTTLTSVLASIGGSSAARRTAFVHVMFNAIGTIVFFILINPYTELITWVARMVIGDPAFETAKLTISIAHVGFNLVNVFVLYFFIKQLVWLVCRIIPAKDEVEVDDLILDENLLKGSPDLALANVNAAIRSMTNVTKGMFEFTYNYSNKKNEKELELARKCEETIDTFDDKIHNYLVALGTHSMSENQMLQVAKDIDTITDLERIGDHLDNILDFFEIRYEKKIVKAEKTVEELEKLFDLIRKSLEQATEAYLTNNEELAMKVKEREEKIDKFTKKYRKRQIKRINNQENEETASGYYADILSNIERIGDHCNNMATNVLIDSFSHEE